MNNKNETKCWDCKKIIPSYGSCVCIGIPELPFEHLAIMCEGCATKRVDDNKRKVEQEIYEI